MTYEARGVYMTLLDRSWLNTGITSDLKELARQLAIPYGKFQRVWLQISAKFLPGDGGKLFNPRQEEEREKAISKSESAGNAAATRWDKKRNADAMRSHTVCIADGMPRAYAIDSVSSPEGGAGESKECEFDDWQHAGYARHPNKSDMHLWQRASVKRFADNATAREVFDKNHKLWCKSEKWNEKQGSFCPKLWRWVEDDGWKYPPPRASPEDAPLPASKSPGELFLS